MHGRVTEQHALGVVLLQLVSFATAGQYTCGCNNPRLAQGCNDRLYDGELSNLAATLQNLSVTCYTSLVTASKNA